MTSHRARLRVRRARHQVAGATAIEKRRALQREPIVKARAKLNTELICGGEQLQPPAHAQQIDHRPHDHKQQQLARQRGTLQCARDQRIDRLPHYARNPHRQHRDADQH